MEALINRDDRHWIACGIRFDASGLHTTTPTWGVVRSLAPGAAITYGLVDPYRVVTPFPRKYLVDRVRVHEVEVRVFDSTLAVAAFQNLVTSGNLLGVGNVSLTMNQSGTASFNAAVTVPLSGIAAVATPNPFANGTFLGNLTANFSTGAFNSTLIQDSLTKQALVEATFPASTNFVTGCLSLPGVGTMSGQFSPPSYGIVGVGTVVPYINGGLTTLNQTGTAGAPNFSLSSVSSGGYIIPQSEQVVLGLALYITTSVFDKSAGVSRLIVRDFINNESDAGRDYLDTRVDIYTQPTGTTGFTSRSWSLRLPEPIELGPRQVLALTISVQSVSPGGVRLTPFLRSRISYAS